MFEGTLISFIQRTIEKLQCDFPPNTVRYTKMIWR